MHEINEGSNVSQERNFFLNARGKLLAPIQRMVSYKLETVRYTVKYETKPVTKSPLGD